MIKYIIDTGGSTAIPILSTTTLQSLREGIDNLERNAIEKKCEYDNIYEAILEEFGTQKIRGNTLIIHFSVKTYP